MVWLDADSHLRNNMYPQQLSLCGDSGTSPIMPGQISLNLINHKIRNNNNVVVSLLVLSVYQKYGTGLEILENLSNLKEAQS